MYHSKIPGWSLKSSFPKANFPRSEKRKNEPHGGLQIRKLAYFEFLAIFSSFFTICTLFWRARTLKKDIKIYKWLLKFISNCVLGDDLEAELEDEIEFEVVKNEEGEEENPEWENQIQEMLDAEDETKK